MRQSERSVDIVARRSASLGRTGTRQRSERCVAARLALLHDPGVSTIAMLNPDCDADLRMASSFVWAPNADRTPMSLFSRVVYQLLAVACGSRSTRIGRSPRRDAATARLRARVLFPVPPF